MGGAYQAPPDSASPIIPSANTAPMPSSRSNQAREQAGLGAALANLGRAQLEVATPDAEVDHSPRPPKHATRKSMPPKMRPRLAASAKAVLLPAQVDRECLTQTEDVTGCSLRRSPSPS